MLSLLSLCRPCRRSTLVTTDLLLHRQFTNSQVLLGRRHKQSTIRIPSKKAMAAKAKRKAAKALRLVDHSQDLTLMDAIGVLRAVEVASPNSAYELFIKTEITNGVTIPKGRVNLPREAKAKSKNKILVFAEGRQAEEAKKAGADFVGGSELIESVISNRIRPTTILSTPALIRAITPRLGRVLGPLGLMPSERRGTVTDDIAGYIQRLQGSSEWRADRAGGIRVPIAMMHFPIEDVVKNVRYFINSVKRATGNTKEAELKQPKNVGNKPVVTISRVMLSSKQGPGIRLADF